MAEGPNNDVEQLVQALCRQVVQHVSDTCGPVRRVRVQSGEVSLEVEWPDPAYRMAQPVLDGGLSVGRPPLPEALVPAYGMPVLAGVASAPAGFAGAGVVTAGSGFPASGAMVGGGGFPGTQVVSGTGAPVAGGAAPVDGSVDGQQRVELRSPMVGTFYRAPEPGAAPFVAVGDVIGVDDQVGIVEAMKLMNPVTADRAGRVLEILVPDGTPVEYDQPLLIIAPVD